MILVTKTGALADPAAVARLRGEFDRQDWVRLPRLLEPALLDSVLDGLDRASWAAFSHGFATELQLADGPVWQMLTFLFNSAGLLQTAHAITGCGPFTWFDGRVYRMAAEQGHYDDWHDDLGAGRRVAVSLNLSRRPYRGGHLALRHKGTGRVDVVTNTGPGDAVMFRLSPDLVHRVAPVEGGEPRTAFAGWFNDSSAGLIDRLRAQATHEV